MEKHSEAEGIENTQKKSNKGLTLAVVILAALALTLASTTDQVTKVINPKKYEAKKQHVIALDKEIQQQKAHLELITLQKELFENFKNRMEELTKDPNEAGIAEN